MQCRMVDTACSVWTSGKKVTIQPAPMRQIDIGVGVGLEIIEDSGNGAKVNPDRMMDLGTPERK